MRIAMKELLDFIESSGELSKYWKTVDQQNDEARKQARRVERARRRIECGSEYQTSEGERDEAWAEEQRLKAEIQAWDEEADQTSEEEEDEYDDEYGYLESQGDGMSPTPYKNIE